MASKDKKTKKLIKVLESASVRSFKKFVKAKKKGDVTKIAYYAMEMQAYDIACAIAKRSVTISTAYDFNDREEDGLS